MKRSSNHDCKTQHLTPITTGGATRFNIPRHPRSAHCLAATDLTRHSDRDSLHAISRGTDCCMTIDGFDECSINRVPCSGHACRCSKSLRPFRVEGFFYFWSYCWDSTHKRGTRRGTENGAKGLKLSRVTTSPSDYDRGSCCMSCQFAAATVTPHPFRSAHWLLPRPGSQTISRVEISPTTAENESAEGVNA